MKYKNLLAGLIGAAITATASANLVYDSTILLSAQGFGAAPRDLTVQATGPNQTGIESGCVGVNSSGAGVIGPSAPRCGVDAAFLPNGVISVGGNEPNPQTISGAKYGIPTLGSLGITDASQIAILFNATEPGGNSINVTDLTLNFFRGSVGGFGFITSIDGSNNFTAGSQPGNGVAGFVFVVDSAQQTFLNSTVFSQPGFANFVLSLDATLANAEGGPESFRIIKLAGAPQCVPSPGISCSPQEIPLPEPGSLALLGIGLLGALAVTRRQGKLGARS